MDCGRLLRQHWQEAGPPEAFQILDSDEQYKLFKKLVKELVLDEKWPIKTLQHRIGRLKEQGLRAGDALWTPYQQRWCPFINITNVIAIKPAWSTLQSYCALWAFTPR